MKSLHICLFSILFFSCTHGDKKTYNITKFDSIICDTIKPIKGINYTTMCIKVKGFADDSIFVSFGDKRYGYYLSKNIDTLLNPDYYGDYPVKFIFNPYKAKKGNLEVTFSLLGFEK